MTAYYNENDPYAAQWLRNLIAAGHIAAGDVDERSIADVSAADLAGYAQCHFFAGIGGWSHALRLAGWPDERPVWTGSCPCQPFSAAGKGRGFDDERHLWPVWFRLIRECAPRVVFGEQVASPAGLGWLDVVQADLEDAEYAVAAVDCCAAGVGAPHWRQRLWFVAADGDVADTEGKRRAWREGAAQGRHCHREAPRWTKGVNGPGGSDEVCAGAMGDTDGDGRSAGRTSSEATRQGHSAVADGGDDCRTPGPTNGAWRAADWIYCRDERWRPVRPGSFPLAHGVPARVGRLRAYGNAVVPQVAAQFVAVFAGDDSDSSAQRSAEGGDA